MSPLTTPRRNQSLPICRYGSTCFKIKNILMMYFLLWIKQKPTSAAQQVDRAESRQRSGVVRRAELSEVCERTHTPHGHCGSLALSPTLEQRASRSLAFADAGSVRSGTHPVFFGFVWERGRDASYCQWQSSDCRRHYHLAACMRTFLYSLSNEAGRKVLVKASCPFQTSFLHTQARAFLRSFYGGNYVNVSFCPSQWFPHTSTFTALFVVKARQSGESVITAVRKLWLEKSPGEKAGSKIELTTLSFRSEVCPNRLRTDRMWSSHKTVSRSRGPLDKPPADWYTAPTSAAVREKRFGREVIERQARVFGLVWSCSAPSSPRSPRSGELRTQKLKSHLVRIQSINVLPLKYGVGQCIAIHATLTARDFCLAYFYPSGPFTCIFSKTSPDFSCVGCG